LFPLLFGSGYFASRGHPAQKHIDKHYHVWMSRDIATSCNFLEEK